MKKFDKMLMVGLYIISVIILATAVKNVSDVSMFWELCLVAGITQLYIIWKLAKASTVSKVKKILLVLGSLILSPIIFLWIIWER